MVRTGREKKEKKKLKKQTFERRFRVLRQVDGTRERLTGRPDVAALRRRGPLWYRVSAMRADKSGGGDQR